jgi:hypothetical protein
MLRFFVGSRLALERDLLFLRKLPEDLFSPGERAEISARREDQ